MKNLKYSVLLVFFFITNQVFAQSNPTVEIVLSQPTAQQGETVTASIYVRNAVNMGGADIGITVDERCLKITERQPGDFLPTAAADGGFAPFAELTDHATRLAAAVTDRTKVANGEGVFFTVSLEVTCADGIAPLTVSFAELSAYVDPSAQDVQLIPYTMGANSVVTINTELSIGSGENPEGVATSAPVTGGATPTLSPEVEASPAESNGSIVIIAVLCLGILGVVFLFIVFRLMRRQSNDDDEVEVSVEDES